jgi:S1-C subfamily serine protease
MGNARLLGTIGFEAPVAVLSLLVATVSGAAPAYTSGEASATLPSVADIAAKIMPSVVTIVATDAQGREFTSGSGFIVARERVVTNWHVIRGADRVTVVTSNDRAVAATEYAADGAHDLAVLVVPGLVGAPVSIGDSKSVRVGNAVVAMGSPRGLSGTVSQGIVSALRDVRGVPVIQTTAPISPGSSGGPLLDDGGRVIGVTSFQIEEGQNINFAHRADFIRPLLRQDALWLPLEQGVVQAKPEAPVAAPPGTRPPTGSRVVPPSPSRDTLLSLLAQPAFAGPELARQLLGPAELELLDLGSQRVYFSLNRQVLGQRSEKVAVAEVSRKFLFDPTEVGIAIAEGMQLSLDGFSMRRSPSKYVLFSTSRDNVHFRVKERLTFPYRQVAYDVSPGELKSYLERYSIYGGRTQVPLGRYAGSFGGSELTNRRAMVSVAGEPSLTRLVAALVRNAATPGDQVQKVLDFVLEEIATDRAASSQRVLKDAASTLMTRTATVETKVSLLASFLEQMPVEYRIVYSPGGVTIALRNDGHFRVSNGTAFSWDGGIWLLVDLTGSRFRLGETPVRGRSPVAEAFLLQKVVDGVIVHPTSGVVVGRP